MSTTDVPGAKAANNDKLAMGCWAEHEDKSLIFVESVEGGTVVYCMFDVAVNPPVEYRGAMPESGFAKQFSYTADKKTKDKWTWHDKTPFDWTRVMKDFPEGSKAVSADDVLSAARRVAESLNLRAGAVRDDIAGRPVVQKTLATMMRGFADALDSLDQ